MARTRLENAQSHYYRLPQFDGLEALSAIDHKTGFPAHYHPTFNISLVYNGSFNTQLSDRLLIAPSGSILVTNPGEIHANPFHGGSASFFTFYIGNDYMRHCNNDSAVFFKQKVIDDQYLFAALHKLSVTISRRVNQSLPDSGFEEIFGRLASVYGNGVSEQHAPQPFFDELLTEDNFEKFSLELAAKQFGIDKFKFIRLFKYQTGLTPANYFIYRRIEKSKVMLAEGHDLLGVAINLGFYDTAHFCNHFKKFTGISPMAFIGGE